MSDRFAQIKSQYRRWPGDTEPNGNWGGDIAWLIDEVEALRLQLAERDAYLRMCALKMAVAERSVRDEHH